MKFGSIRTAGLSLALAAGTVVACKESTSPSLAGIGQSMSLSFAGVRPPGTSGIMSVQNSLGDPLTQTVGANTLVITSAQVVLRKISLKRVESSSVDCDTMPESLEHSCEHFTIRDLLVSLPLTPGVQTTLSIAVDSGHYRGVEFKIHKPGSDATDQAFVAANPDFATISIQVKGTWNGTPFTYTSDLNAEQEYDFVPPLVVDASGNPTNLTIRMDLTTWFVDTGTGGLIDPGTAAPGGANEGLVRFNIRNSIRAFEDRNRDGDERNG
jgi:hypothetical protein